MKVNIGYHANINEIVKIANIYRIFIFDSFVLNRSLLRTPNPMTMKKTAFLALSTLLLFVSAATSQSISETVRFDTYVSPTNNDLVNNFSNTSWMSTVTSGGITGGALLPPDSISWGNDKLNYCRNYFNISDSVMENSISFLYDASKVRPSAFQRAADIWIFSGVANHWIIYSVNYNQHLTIISYGSASDSMLTPMISGHWYKLVATCKTLSIAPGDWVYTKAEVFDLGTTGTGSPLSIGSNTSSFHDFDVAQSNFLDVSMSGAGFGGSALLDDFTFRGIPAANSCSPTGIAPILHDRSAFTLYPQPILSDLVIQSPLPAEMDEVSVFNALGERISFYQNARTPFTVDMESWAGGIYFLEIRSEGKVYRNKVLKQ